MEYKTTHFGVSLDSDLNQDEIEAVRLFWRRNRENKEWINHTWNQYKLDIGLSHESKQLPCWKILNKEKWLWAKLKYGF